MYLLKTTESSPGRVKIVSVSLTIGVSNTILLFQTFVDFFTMKFLMGKPVYASHGKILNRNRDFYFKYNSRLNDV